MTLAYARATEPQRYRFEMELTVMPQNTIKSLLSLACIASVGVFAIGCNTQYVLEFQDGKTGKPIVGMPVKGISATRFYSFLDIRHYVATDSHKSVIAEGLTNEAGMVVLSMPHDLDLWKVCLNNEWFWERNDIPSWQPMQTKREAEAGQKNTVHSSMSNRPLIRMLSKKKK